MRKKKFLVVTLCIFLAMVMLLSLMLSIFGRASAVTQSQIDKLKEEAKALEEKQAELQEQIDSRTDDIVAMMARYELLEQRADLTRAEIENLNLQIQLCEEELDRKTVELADAEEAESEQLRKMKSHLRALEENGSFVTYLEILFQASSFRDLLSRLDLIEAILDADQKMADNLALMRQDVAAAKVEVETAMSAYEITRSEQEDKKAELEASMAEAKETMDLLQENIDELTAVYEANEAEEDALQEEIDDLMEKLRQQELANAGPSVSGTGRYIWPATSTYVTSSFGTRWHPVLGGYRTHYGIDIGASYGTNIYAADSGTVEISTYSSSYGNYVLINHGGGNATLYAHMSTRYVEAGQRVSQGQVIGLVGSTGISTGPHLHYETRENGVRVDPMKYY